MISWSWCGWRRKVCKTVHFESDHASPTIPEAIPELPKSPNGVSRGPIHPSDSTSMLDFSGMDFGPSKREKEAMEDEKKGHDSSCLCSRVDDAEGESTNGSTVVCTCKTPLEFISTGSAGD